MGTSSIKHAGEIVHCLSIDVEGFVEGMAESFHIPLDYFDDKATDNEIETNVNETLAGLDELGLKATFFVLGRIAERLPGIVRSIAESGHEIGSHSFRHKRIFNQSREEFRSELTRSRSVLQDVSGQEIRGFRAPDFSITADTLWILDEIAAAGFEYDTSLTPTDIHDVYGMKDVEPHIHRFVSGLWEFPASTFRLFGRTIPFGGGGYLRLYPVAVTRLLMKRSARFGYPAMLYSHPYELGSQIPKIRPLSRYRQFRHYYHRRDGLRRLRSVVKDFKIGRIDKVLNALGMSQK